MTTEADRLVGSGFGGEIYQTASGMIRRKATDTLLFDSYRRQCRFLPELAVRVPFAVPLPMWNDDGSMSYQRLAGQPLQPEMLPTIGATQLADELALFVTALHSISTASAIEWGVTPLSKTTKLLAAADRVLPELPEAIRERARAWRRLFHEPPHRNVLIHGDLWHENLLVDVRSGRLSGVIDFDETSIGDPAWDFATQLHCGEEFTKLVIDRCPQSVGDPTLLSRARALFALRTFEGLDWALRHKDEAEFKQGLHKLHSAEALFLPNELA